MKNIREVRRAAMPLLVMLTLGLFGCGGGNSEGDTESGTPNVPPVTTGEWYRPGVDTSWQWQLSEDATGTVNTGYNVGMYDVDAVDSSDQIDELHAAGRKVVCYFSAGSYEEWRPDAADFAADVLGRNLEGWEGEKWLDIRADSVKSIMRTRLEAAKQSGCDGVEPDNVDGYANDTGFLLTAQDQLDYNVFIANTAHELGLAVGLKNDLDQVTALVPYFDFAVNEQCHEYDECDWLLPFTQAGKPVFNAEYAARYVADQSRLCADALAANIRTLVLPLELDDSFRISCDSP